MNKLIIIILSATISLSSVHAQHSEENEYAIVAKRILTQIQSKDYPAFKMSCEQAGLFIKSEGDEPHSFWIMMKGYIESDSQCKGWENLGQKKIGNHLFLASYIIRTETPHFVTLEFYKHDSLWILRSFHIESKFTDFVDKWGFTLNK